jgi:hypothetical protein
MPKQKDLKRLTRSRMQKTGESYTTARARLLAKRRSPLPPNDEIVRLAGMTDDAVRKKTGKTWREWIRVLDAVDAAAMPHRAIAAHLHELGVPDWWAQMVTVGYERVRGLRDVGQRRGGGYEATKSKTFAVPLARLWTACATERARGRWLAGAKLTVRKATPRKSLRLRCADGTAVQLYFAAKGETKSQLAVQHAKLASKAHAAQAKEQWSERLAALAAVLG